MKAGGPDETRSRDRDLATPPRRVRVPAPAATLHDHERATRLLRTNAQRLILDGPVRPRWLPDGARFVYDSVAGEGTRHWLVDPSVASRTELAADDPLVADAPDNSAQSPDGTWVV